MIERSSPLLPSNARNHLKAKGVTHSGSKHLPQVNKGFVGFFVTFCSRLKDLPVMGGLRVRKHLGERLGYISVSSILLQ